MLGLLIIFLGLHKASKESIKKLGNLYQWFIKYTPQLLVPQGWDISADLAKFLDLETCLVTKLQTFHEHKFCTDNELKNALYNNPSYSRILSGSCL